MINKFKDFAAMKSKKKKICKQFQDQTKNLWMLIIYLRIKLFYVSLIDLCKLISTKNLSAFKNFTLI